MMRFGRSRRRVRRPSARSRGNLRGRRGTATLEFAFVALPMVMLVLGVMELAYDLFVQAVLDSAVASAARLIQVGSQQGTNNETSAQFVVNSVCPSVGGLLDCSRLVVGVAPIASGYDYATNPSPLSLLAADGLVANGPTGTICTGVAGQLMVLEAWYAAPTFVAGLIPGFATTFNGNLVHLTSSSAGFVNELFSGGQSTGVGC